MVKVISTLIEKIIFWERYSLLKWGLILEIILMNIISESTNFISISRPVWKCPCKNDCKKSLFISDVMWSWNTNTTTTTTPRWGFMEITGNGGENEWVVAWQQCSLLSEAAQLVAHKGWAASYIVLKSYDFYKTSQKNPCAISWFLVTSKRLSLFEASLILLSTSFFLSFFLNGQKVTKTF